MRTSNYISGKFDGATVSKKTPGLVSLRSEPWTDLGGSELRAAIKQHIDAKVVQDPRIGFRCARPGR